ncbi:hypothetical protein R5R35_006231 [Gryllus longicercus]|uniref:Accessory gland protein n=1 Tax=Gryllus longicercus TaxID=2509291 RepID=A0AAN9ZIW3_9ORTH
MKLEVFLVFLCVGACLSASPRWSSASLQALKARRRGTSVDAAPADALQARAVCAYTLQERTLQLQDGMDAKVQEVVCAGQRPRLRLGLRDAAAGAVGPLRLSCLQAQVRMGEHVLRSGCVLVHDSLQEAGDPRPDLAL